MDVVGRTKREGVDASQEAARLSPTMELALRTPRWPPSSSCGFRWQEMLRHRWQQPDLALVMPWLGVAPA